MTTVEARQFLESHKIQYILAQFVDIHGAPKTKCVPVGHFEDIVKNGAGFAGFAVWGLGLAPHEADYMAVGDLRTLSLVPWQPGYARIVCDGHVQGQPWPYDSRYVLKRQIARMAEHGLGFDTGMEPEFVLLRRDDQGRLWPFDDSDHQAKPCYDFKGLSRSRAFLEALTGSLLAVGIDVYQIDHEDSNGQFEVNYTYTDGLTSCDRMVFVKMAASEIAHGMGMVCSFMPKPFSNRPGNGQHIHMSASRDGHNAFEDPSDPRGLRLSALAYQFLAGLLAHARGLAALCAPTVNSYKRLVVGRSLTGSTWAPAYISYGDNNRSAMVRVPGGRLELRLPDGACNPYLATAALIAAGLDGVERGLDPGAPQNRDLYSLPTGERERAGVALLPQNLHEALVALEGDTVLRAALGPLAEEFLILKHQEWVEYMRHVSDWEIAHYVDL